MDKRLEISEIIWPDCLESSTSSIPFNHISHSPQIVPIPRMRNKKGEVSGKVDMKTYSDTKVVKDVQAGLVVSSSRTERSSRREVDGLNDALSQFYTPLGPRRKRRPGGYLALSLGLGSPEHHTGYFEEIHQKLPPDHPLDGQTTSPRLPQELRTKSRNTSRKFKAKIKEETGAFIKKETELDLDKPDESTSDVQKGTILFQCLTNDLEETVARVEEEADFAVTTTSDIPSVSILPPVPATRSPAKSFGPDELAKGGQKFDKFMMDAACLRLTTTDYPTIPAVSAFMAPMFYPPYRFGRMEQPNQGSTGEPLNNGGQPWISTTAGNQEPPRTTGSGLIDPIPNTSIICQPSKHMNIIAPPPYFAIGAGRQCALPPASSFLPKCPATPTWMSPVKCPPSVLQISTNYPAKMEGYCFVDNYYMENAGAVQRPVIIEDTFGLNAGSEPSEYTELMPRAKSSCEGNREYAN
ncbi:uncharacterized protein LOC129583668 isoform X2 [Paramacrobiotus metropolitanus]|uniref:uncharacterized protein LOC129583668 isoform X2 n=1 Tax=Paramacrobiotus metropolitanus TaxID=2943436 RepID=UPI002445D63B|nr:uncharacterized protein LOC129583668 isoform X2 [Paramacrobiotus metropolitanus]